MLAKAPAGMQTEIRDGYWACFDTADLTTEPGPRLVELVDARLTAFADRYGPTYPAAMKNLLTDREGLAPLASRRCRSSRWGRNSIGARVTRIGVKLFLVRTGFAASMRRISGDQTQYRGCRYDAAVEFCRLGRCVNETIGLRVH